MPRPALPSDSIVASVRRHFQLTQADLAAWLGVSEAQAGHLETGRRGLAGAVEETLAPFVATLPAPAPAAGALRLASAVAVAPPALAPPEAAPLAARLDDCQHQARRLRRQLAPLEAQATAAARWAAALPVLRAALPPDPAAEPDPVTDWPTWQIWHRHRWLDKRPISLPSDLSARYHLLRLRAEALEAEAAALSALLSS